MALGVVVQGHDVALVGDDDEDNNNGRNLVDMTRGTSMVSGYCSLIFFLIIFKYYCCLDFRTLLQARFFTAELFKKTNFYTFKSS